MKDLVTALPCFILCHHPPLTIVTNTIIKLRNNLYLTDINSVLR